MTDTQFSLADIHIEVAETADRYIKAVLINAKKRYFRVLRKLERNGILIFDLEKYASNLICDEDGYSKVDNEIFVVGQELFTMEKSELTEALFMLTPTQRDILLRAILLRQSQEEIASVYGITTRMVRKHKHIALEKLRRSLTYEA